MRELNKFRVLNKLKSVYRMSRVDDRHESTAEHTWSAVMLADYFLEIVSEKLDRLKVFELLLYHDIVEIETGDIPNHPDVDRTNKREMEDEGMQKLKAKLPKEMQTKYDGLYHEYEDQTSREAMFAKAIDALDAPLHFIDYKEDWKGWTEEFIRSRKEHIIKEFPELLEAFNELLKYMRDNGYFSQ